MRLVSEARLLDVFSPELKKAATRNGVGDALVEIGEIDKNVLAASADVAGSVQLNLFADRYPDRFVQVGVAEQNLAAVSAGLAYCGKTVFIGAYAVFSPGRNWEQIRTTICYPKANVKIIGSHAGLNVGPDGATHQALEDIAITRCLPNLTVLSPCDYEEAKKAAYAAWKGAGPFYIRCTREKVPIFTTGQTPFEVGRMNLLNEGSDIGIVATGGCVYEALIAAEELEKEGISAAVANLHTISPIDSSGLERLAKECGTIITVEEHQINGGLGSAVCEALAETYPVRVRRLGVKMQFGESGTGSELLGKYGLDKEGIIKAAKEEMTLKK
ncbi:MAG: transketolase family protein [Candidatus Micrarchaeota archaeon]|nr:transketolase family protein [Candidatus Micrarchaeota archaeon]